MNDAINPSHYKDGFSNGAQVIDITENLNFNRGNAVKYLARAGRKNPDTDKEDLFKALWYLNRELHRCGYQIPENPIKVHRRKWDSIHDVPNNVEVFDRDNWMYVWDRPTLRRLNARTRVWEFLEDFNDEDVAYPLTEVVPRPEYQIPDNPVAKTLPRKWDSIHDLPDRVPAVDLDNYRYTWDGTDLIVLNPYSGLAECVEDSDDEDIAYPLTEVLG